LTLKEASYINKSLSFLEQVVVSTCDKSRDHVPYRQCKLTNMLKNSIGGNCKTVFIANVWPEAQHIEETISTLRFATRMMKVTNVPIVNQAQDQNLLIKKYEREIRDLKQELTLHDVLAAGGVDIEAAEPYNAEKQYDI
jgi:kinesin family member 6/9